MSIVSGLTIVVAFAVIAVWFDDHFTFGGSLKDE
jgi:hypothetical protein